MKVRGKFDGLRTAHQAQRTRRGLVSRKAADRPLAAPLPTSECLRLGPLQAKFCSPRLPPRRAGSTAASVPDVDTYRWWRTKDRQPIVRPDGLSKMVCEKPYYLMIQAAKQKGDPSAKQQQAPFL